MSPCSPPLPPTHPPFPPPPRVLVQVDRKVNSLLEYFHVQHGCVGPSLRVLAKPSVLKKQQTWRYCYFLSDDVQLSTNAISPQLSLTVYSPQLSRFCLGSGQAYCSGMPFAASSTVKITPLPPLSSSQALVQVFFKETSHEHSLYCPAPDFTVAILNFL